MNLVEFFAGSRSIWETAEQEWINVFSTDLYPFEWIHLAKDVREIKKEDIPFIPDIFWASPVCTTFSIASCGTHRNIDYSPKTEEAKIWDQIVLKMLDLIKEFLVINPKMKVKFENPRWILRKMPYIIEFMKEYWFVRHTVTYCSYWDIRMKPTDIWTNDLNWKPRPMCHNYKYDKEWNVIDKHCHHESARRWARTWTQWLKWDYERSKIPHELCKEIILSFKK